MDDTRSLRQLLARGFDPNTLDPKKRPGLVLALSEESFKAAELLIAHPQIDVNLLSADGESPLMMAALRGQDALVRRLIERGANVNKSGWAPLHYAATGGHVAVIRHLLAHHANIDAESPNGSTPLMLAAQYGNIESVKLLVDQGAQPGQKNKLGMTALDFAQMGSRPDAIAYLSGLARSAAAAGQHRK